MSIIYPQYFYLVERVPGGWDFIWNRKLFYTPEGKRIEPKNREKLYGLNKQQITIELFRINGGSLGYYLANMRDRTYYYCGRERESIKEKLLELGIGRRKPKEIS